MGVSDKLTKEVVGLSVLVIIIVVMSIVLLKFKDVDGVTEDLKTTIDTTVSAIDEPVTWISIVVILIVLGWLVFYLQKSKKPGM